ncbi:hypothetical protein TWF718_005689 [Orbilia javanica]|uniref:Uncharacterized protein n=1 Tax=Orbilia javanica TaxID=47235 RepID=A0AAN8MSA9_9PEZI
MTEGEIRGNRVCGRKKEGHRTTTMRCQACELTAKMETSRTLETVGFMEGRDVFSADGLQFGQEVEELTESSSLPILRARFGPMEENEIGN